MHITNKKLAFYVSLIAITAVLGLIISGHITNEQAALIIPPLLVMCGIFMGLDALYDYLNIAFRIGETIVSLTPSLEDDKRLAEIKALVKQLQLDTDELAVGGKVMEWMDKNWKDIPEIFLPRGELDKTDATVTTTTTISNTTPIAGTNVSFFTPDNTDKANG